MPREALLRNCCVLVANAGAGFGPDFALPNEFHFDINELSILPKVAAKIYYEYDFHLQLCEVAINKVKRERLLFTREVSSMMNLVDRTY
jgi:hypothetical protein